MQLLLKKQGLMDDRLDHDFKVEILESFQLMHPQTMPT
jgi:hypothetical protein